MGQIARRSGCGIVRNLNELDKRWASDWLAIVHADGNGLGKVFSTFHERINPKTDATYIAVLPKFSQALDRCT
jgi:hypothetical protein